MVTLKASQIFVSFFFSYQKQHSAIMREGLFFIIIFIMSLKLVLTTIKERCIYVNH